MCYKWVMKQRFGGRADIFKKNQITDAICVQGILEPFSKIIRDLDGCRHNK